MNRQPNRLTVSRSTASQEPAQRLSRLSEATTAALTALIAPIALLAAAPAHALDHSWTGGNFIAGTTAPNPLPIGSTLNISGVGQKLLLGVHFSNLGTVNWLSGGGSIGMGSGASFNNLTLWNLQHDGVLDHLGGATSTFTNALSGTLRKTAGAGTTRIGNNTPGFAFVNAGTIDAQVGTLELGGPGSFNHGTRFKGAGRVLVTAASTFNGRIETSNLVLASGLQTGNAALMVGTASLGGATLGGNWVVDSGSTLRLQNPGGHALQSALLTNNGSLVWLAGSGGVNLQNGAQIANNGLFDAQGDGPISVLSSGTLSNASGAVLRKSGGGGVTQLGADTTLSFSNRGTIETQVGTLEINATSTFHDGTVFSGAGRVVVNGNSSFNGSVTASNLQFNAGTQTGSGAVLHGSAQWRNSSMGGSWTVAAGASLTTEGASTKTANTNTMLVNDGSLAMLAGSGNLVLGSAATVNNRGLWDIQGDSSVVSGGGTTMTVLNAAAGTLRKSGGTGVSQIGNGNSAFFNSGLIDVQSGTLQFAHDTTFNSGTRITGAGRVRVTGSATYAGAIEAANLTIDAGEPRIQTGVATVLSGQVQWQSGLLIGGWTYAAGSTLTLQGAGSKRLGGGSFSNAGSVVQAADSSALAVLAGTVTNTGNWTLQGDNTLTAAGGLVTFTNSGLVSKTGGSGVAEVGGVGLALVNSGTFDVASGTLRLSGANSFGPGTVFSGAGRVDVNAASSFMGAYQSSNLRITGGLQTGANAVMNGHTIWLGGSLRGTWAVPEGSALELRGAASKEVVQGLQLNNHGLVLMDASSTSLRLAQSQVVNHGRWQLEGDAGFVSAGGVSLGTFINHGTLAKTGGTGLSSLSDGAFVQFINHGVVDVQVGGIGLPTNFINTGTLQGDGSYFTPGTLTNHGTVAPGSSGAGSLDLTSGYIQGATGTLALDLGNMASFDTLRITGPAVLGGSLLLSCLGNCEFSVGDSLLIVDALGSLAGTFSGGVTLSGFASGAFSVQYSANQVHLLVTEAVTAVPEPQSWLLMGGGLLLLMRGLARRRAAPA